MQTENGTKRPLVALNKLQSIILGKRGRLTRVECLELENWVLSLEDEVLAARKCDRVG